MIVGMLINKAYDFMVHISQFIDIKNFENALIIIATFYIAMLAFMIPVSIQMVRNIRQDFPTIYTDRKFRESFPYKWLHVLLLSQIFLIAIFVSFSHVFRSELRIIFVVVLILMFITSWLMFVHIKRLMMFVDKEKVLKRLVKDTNKHIKGNKENDNIQVGLNAFADILEKEISSSPDQNYISAILKNIENYAEEFSINNKSLEYFTIVSNGIEKVAKKAIQINNIDIAFVINNLINDIIQKIVSENDNVEYLKILFKNHKEIAKHAIQINNNATPLFAYSWYFYFVFDRFSNRDVLKLKYLDIFDEYQFEYITIIVKENKFQIFKDFISWSLQGVGFHDYIPDFCRMCDFKTGNELSESFDLLYTKTNLQNFRNLVDDKKSKFSEESKAEEFKREAYLRFVFNNLQRMILDVAYYCLQAERYEYIKCIWTDKQPRKSKVIWIGHDIYPKSIPKIIELIVRGIRYNYNKEEEFLVRVGRESSNDYETDYRIYLIAYLIYNDKKKFDEKKYGIPKLPFGLKIERLKHDLEELKKNVTDVIRVERLNIFQRLGFYDINARKISNLKRQVHKLLELLISKCQQDNANKIIEAKISDTLVNYFKQKFIEEIKKKKLLINFMIKKGFGIHKYSEVVENNPTIIIYERTLKETFIEENNYSLKQIGINSLAHCVAHKILRCFKNGDVLEKIKSKCKHNNLEDFEFILDKHNNDGNLFIIEINKIGYISNKYRDHFQCRSKDQDCHLMGINGFHSYLSFNDKRIRIFSLHDNTQSNHVLILNEKKFITYTQFKINAEEKNVIDDFYIDVRPMDEQTINKIIKNSNDDKNYEERKKEMQQEVIFEIYEQYEVEFPDDFEGYIFDISDSELSL